MQMVNPTFKISEASTSPSTRLTKSESKSELKKIRKAMKPLHERLQAEKSQSLLCIFQAMDAAGKDGTIRAVFSGLNPVGIHAAAFGRPTKPELSRDYLWRVHQKVPPKGKIGIFNRSHYEELITVRVFPEFLAAQRIPAQDISTLMEQRIENIVEFEKMLTQTGTRILKFFLHVGLDAQKKRLLDRIENPDKHWKYDGQDIIYRERWPDFMAAYESALLGTHRPHAPWFCVPADDKPTMRVLVAQKIHDTLSDMNPQFPVVDAERRAGIYNDKDHLLKT